MNAAHSTVFIKFDGAKRDAPARRTAAALVAQILSIALLLAFALTIGSMAQAETPAIENTGIFRIVPGDAFVGGSEPGDECRYEEGKTSGRIEIQMSFGKSKLKFTSDDENLRAVLRQPIRQPLQATPAQPAVNGAAQPATYAASVEWIRDAKTVGTGLCEVAVAGTPMQSSRPVQINSSAEIFTGYRFEVSCQPKSHGTLQGLIYCRLRTRSR